MHNRTNTAFIFKADLMEDEPFPVVEADTKAPFLPRHQVAVHDKRRTFGLDDVEGLGRFGVEATFDEIAVFLVEFSGVRMFM